MKNIELIMMFVFYPPLNALELPQIQNVEPLLQILKKKIIKSNLELVTLNSLSKI